MNDRATLLSRPYWTPAEAASMLRLNKSTITRWIQNGLPVHDVGGTRYVRPTEVTDWASDPTRRTRRRRTG